MEQLIHCAIVIAVIFSLLKEEGEKPQDKVNQNNGEPLAAPQLENNGEPLAEPQPNQNNGEPLAEPQPNQNNGEPLAATLQNQPAPLAAPFQTTPPFQAPLAAAPLAAPLQTTPPLQTPPMPLAATLKNPRDSCRIIKSIFSFKEILSLIPGTNYCFTP